MISGSSLNIIYVLLSFGIKTVFTAGQSTQFLRLQPVNARNAFNSGKPVGNLTGRSYEAPSSISTGYRNSMASNPFMMYPNTDNMNFRLPGAPPPPDPPGLGYAGTGNNMNYQPFINSWNNYPGVGAAYGSSSSNGGNYGANNGNNYYSGGSGSNMVNGMGGYGSNNGFTNNNGQLSGNGPINYGASGGDMNGYRPSQQQTGLGNNAYGSQPANAGNNVQNGYIVNSGTNGQSGGGGGNVNQYGMTQTDSSSSANPGSNNYGGGGNSAGTYYSGPKYCVPDMFPNNQGVCTLRNQLKRNCFGQMSAVSSGCSGKELCCFNPSVTVAPSTTTTVPTVATTTVRPSSTVASTVRSTTIAPTATTRSSSSAGITTPISSGTTGTSSSGTATTTPTGVTVPADRYCIPDTDSSVVDGVCRSNLDVPTKCAGIFASTSTNCYADESCCYNIVVTPTTTSRSTGPITSSTTVGATTTFVPPTTTREITLTPSRGPVTTSTIPVTISTAPGTPRPGCSPGSYAAITNGVCTPVSQIAQSCKGKQISPSLDCGAYEYCCFVADSSNGGGFYQPGVSCSPDNNPMIGNGRCIDPGQVASQCPGMLLSNSVNCQSSQLCCYTSIPTSAPVTTTTTARTTVTTTGLPPPTTVTTVLTQPTTSPTVSPITTTRATSVPPSTTTSTGLTTTARITTASMTPVTATTVTQIPAGRICRPGSRPYLQLLSNGTCVASRQLSQNCKGLELDYSLDCGIDEYCCYSHGNSSVQLPSPITIAPGSCTPDADPRINNGFCVTLDNLVQSCSAMQASTSPNCGSTQFCCYTQMTGTSKTSTTGTTTSLTNTTPLPTTSTATVPTSTIITTGITSGTATTRATTGSTATGTATSSTGTITATSPGTVTRTGSTTSATSATTSSSGSGSCSPQGQPNVTNGVCTSISDLPSKCQGQQALPSLSCGYYEYCCFNTAPVSAVPMEGIVLSGSAFSQSSSGKGQAIFDSLNKGGVITGGHGQLQVNVSGNSGNQLLQSNGPPSKNQQPCAPDNVPGTTDGFCVPTGEMLTQCNGNDISASIQCGTDQFCCYTPPSIVRQGTTTSPYGNYQVSSTTAAFTTGTSATTSSPSTTSISTTPSTSTTTSTTTSTATSATPSTTTIPTTTSTAPTMPSTMTTSPTTTGLTITSSYKTPCSPLTEPTVNDGTCTDVSQVETDCLGMRLSASLQCSMTQFCCFVEVTTSSTTTSKPSSSTAATSTTTTGTSLSGCTPLTDPSVINGVCTDVNQLETNCLGMRLSMSLQCSSYQFCCFGGSSSTVTSTPTSTTSSTAMSTTTTGSSGGSCTPLTDPSFTDGICAEVSQLSTVCLGMRLAQSLQCSNTQFCCFGRMTTPGMSTTVSTAVTTTPITSTATTLTTPTTATTTPSTTASTSTSTSTMTTSTTSQTTSPTSTSTSTATSTASTPTTTLTTPLRIACIPSTAPSVTNGLCTSLDQLGLLCHGQRISKSKNCQQSDFCCFPPDTITQGGCTPSSTPSVHNGTCVANANLASQCRGLRMSQSSDCPSYPGSMCCFQADGMSGNKANGVESGCSPITAPEVTDGVCTEMSQLSAKCGGQAFAKSNQCKSGDFCCFNAAPPSENMKQVIAAPTCSPKTQPTVHNGMCVAIPQLSSQCRGLTFSKSVDCANDQFCCFTSQGSDNGQLPQTCTPNTQPTITNGFCASTSQLSAQCKKLTFSKSANCGASQFCCFNSSSIVGAISVPATAVATGIKSSSSVGGSCVPKTDSTATDGVCVESSKISVRCAGKRLSKSGDCLNSEFCCFSGVNNEDKKTDVKSSPSSGLEIHTCSPVSAPSISNGSCVAVTDLTEHCSGLQLSKSADCPDSHFCCFSGDDRSAVATKANGQCAPVTEPMVTNGACVNANQLATQCAGLRLAKSGDCENDQYCCFGSDRDASGSRNLCSPNTQPSITNGTCVETNQLAAQCLGQRLSKSTDCSSSQFCCFSATPSGDGSSSGGACTPKTEPSITNGKCVNPGQLQAQCTGQRLAKSNNCASNQFCCFDGPPVGLGASVAAIKVSGGACSPRTAPTVTDGMCVDLNQLTDKCTTLRMSKSSDCSGDQFCCFSSANDRSGDSDSCMPNTEPGITNGTCISTSQLVSQCSTLRMSKSGNCAPDQFCCFSAVTNRIGTDSNGLCIPRTQTAVTDGACVDTSNIAVQCANKRLSKSGNCGKNQFCCFNGPHVSPVVSVTTVKASGSACSPKTSPTITNGMCFNTSQLVDKCSALRMSKSADCSTDQFCCFSPLSEGSGDGGSCMPNTQPTVTNGTCVTTSQLVDKCSTLRMSKSGNCAADQFCCFATINNRIGSAGNGMCMPKTQLLITDGACVDTSDVAVQCGQQRMSKSGNCGNDQFCCFSSETNVKSSSVSCVPNTEPSVNNGTCVHSSQMISQCSNQRMSKSGNCDSSEFCCFSSSTAGHEEAGFGNLKTGSGSCTPISNPMVNNGVCTDLALLNSQCNGKQLAKSSQCQSSQFCCFSSPTISKTAAATGACTPVTQASVNNGTCVDLTQLGAQCQNLRFAKSHNCSTNEFCCFDLPPSVSPQNPCTPETEPAVTNGVCLISGDLPIHCGGSSRAAKSINCLSSQWCCFNVPPAAMSNNKESSIRNITTLNGDGNAKIHLQSSSMCSPNSDPSITNGVCVFGRDLQAQCVNKRAAPSVDCPQLSWCCFDGALQNVSAVNAVNNVKIHLQSGSTGGSTCSPNSNPSVTNGVCVFGRDLQTQCVNKRAAPSVDCPQLSWCCFDGTLISFTNKESGLKNISILNGDNHVKIGLEQANSSLAKCTPNSDTSVANGVCVFGRDLQTQCVDKRAAPSVDCSRFSWCCFESSPSSSLTTAIAATIGTTTAPVTEGIALINPIRIEILVSKRCSPTSDPFVHDGSCSATNSLTTACAGQQLSKSPDCEVGQFCCFNRSSSVQNKVQMPVPTVITCTPNVDSSVHNGQCMRMREISEKCIDRKASPSADCAMGQWCCFGENSGDDSKQTGNTIADTTTEVTTTTEAVTGVCAPNSQPQLRTGMCQTIRQLQELCVDKQAAPSPDCEMGHWCCYSDPASNKDLADTTTTEIAITVPEVQSSDGTVCTPNAAPNVENGMCMPTRDLRSRCRNRRVSKSPQCRMGQWCCFVDPLQNNSSTVDGFSPHGRSELSLDIPTW